MNILIINGPNINLLNLRDENYYGKNSYEDLIFLSNEESQKLGINVELFQSNSEGKIIDKIHNIIKEKNIDGLLINPGAYTHYSIAIRDAIEILDIPVIEIHISNISKRESFRKQSVISEVCDGQIMGLGLDGYRLGILALNEKLK